MPRSINLQRAVFLHNAARTLRLVIYTINLPVASFTPMEQWKRYLQLLVDDGCQKFLVELLLSHPKIHELSVANFRRSQHDVYGTEEKMIVAL